MNNPKNRIHILGSSGSGVSTLGQNLAKHLGIPFFDCDDYYWEQSDPPFQKATPVEQRQIRLLADLEQHDEWILSGSQHSWSEPFEKMYTQIVFLWVPPEERVKRLKQRESELWSERILSGGDMHCDHLKFLDWAHQYDEGIQNGRSMPKHQGWLKRQTCPILNLEGCYSKDEAMKLVLEKLAL